MITVTAADVAKMRSRYPTKPVAVLVARYMVHAGRVYRRCTDCQEIPVPNEGDPGGDSAPARLSRCPMCHEARRYGRSGLVAPACSGRTTMVLPKRRSPWRHVVPYAIGVPALVLCCGGGGSVIGVLDSWGWAWAGIPGWFVLVAYLTMFPYWGEIAAHTPRRRRRDNGVFTELGTAALSIFRLFF